MSAVDRSRGRTTRKEVNGTEYRLTVETDAPATEYNGRVTIENLDGGDRWQFGVTDDQAAEFRFSTTVDDAVAEPAIPEAIAGLLRDLGLEVEN